MGAKGDLQLALPGDGLGLLLVIVDAPDNQGCAVTPGQGDHPLEPFFPVLQIYGVDHRLALQALQRRFDDAGVGGVDHDDLLGQHIQEAQHVRRLVPVRVLQAHVEEMGAPSHLAPPHLARLIDGALGDEAPEPPAAQDVGALADYDGAGVFVHYKDFDARDAGLPGAGQAPGFLPRGCFGQQPDVVGHRAAAPAYQVHPALLDEPADGLGHLLRRLVVAPIFVGKAGVGHAGDGEPGKLGQGANVVGHKVGARGAVEAYPKQVPVGQGRVEGLGILPGQQGAHGFDGALHGDWNIHAQLLQRPVDAIQSCLDVHGVLGGLQEQHIHAPLDQTQGLLMEGIHQLVEGDAPRHRDGLGGGTHGTGHVARLVRAGGLIAQPPSQRRRRPVDAPGFVGQLVLGQDHRCGAEGVGLHYIGPCIQEVLVHPGYGVGLGQHQVLVAAFVLGPSEVLGPQSLVLDGGTHSTIQHQDALFQGVGKGGSGSLVHDSSSFGSSMARNGPSVRR